MLLRILLLAFIAFVPAVPVFAQEGVLDDEYPDAREDDFAVVPDNCRGDKAATECGFEELVLLVKNIIALLLYLAIIVGTFFFVYAGFLYLTNSGDSTRISQAKSIFSNVIIGLLVAFAAYLIVEVIVTTLGVCEDFNLFTAIETSC